MKNGKIVIVGINDSHDASASVVVNGRLLCAMSEERFQRVKSMGGFPKNAIEACLTCAGISRDEVDHVAVGTTHVTPENLYNAAATFTIRDLNKIEDEYWQPVIYGDEKKELKSLFPDYKPKGTLYYPVEKFPLAFSRELSEEMRADIASMRREYIARYFSISNKHVHFVDHHTAHAYYAYFASPVTKKKTLVITADAGGDGAYESVWVVQDGIFRSIHKGHTNLLASIYSYTTLSLGMRPNEHEYKVMGLAPYAKAHEKRGPFEVFSEALMVNELSFTRGREVKDLFKYFKDKLKYFRFDGIAGGLQDFTEQRIVEWVQNAVHKTKVHNVVLSGGLFLNIKANKAIAAMKDVHSLFVPPGIGDESLSIGAAFFVLKSIDDSCKIEPLKHGYLGDRASKEDIEALIAHPFIQKHYSVKRNANPDDVAKILARGEICALFQSDMEFGPRALGHRSIIADPSKPESVQRINEAIKMRDFWMPFTPSILSERMRSYIILPKKEISDQYMTVSFDTTARGRRHLKAAIHPYDYTARPQRVDKKIAPEYYAIIKAFENRTGIGAVLNTSLNIHGKPIVRKPVEIAKEIVSNADVCLDNIYVEGVLLKKRKQG